MIPKKKKKSKGDYYFTVACSKKYKCRVKKKLLEHWIHVPMKSHNQKNEDTREML